MILAANLPYELFNRNTSYLRICTLLKYVKQTNIKKKDQKMTKDKYVVRYNLDWRPFWNFEWRPRDFF